MDNIIIYNTDDGAASVKLYANDGTVWLARAEIAALFQKDRSTISKHIKNIFAEGELLRNVERCLQHSDLLSLGKIKRLGYV